jgi:hypothetical protein
MSVEAGQELRHEIKLVCQEASFERVLMALRLDPSGLHRLHPTRRVQSIYFDSPTRRALHENLSGQSRREKLRLRWYGNDAQSVLGQLERKVRANSLGWKDVYVLAEPVAVQGIERTRFVDRIRELAPPAWQAALGGGIEPVQWISYRRDYQETADGKLRVTLDRELAAWDQRSRRELSNAGWSALPRLTVVEIKCAPEHHAEAAALVGRLPLSVGRCSKFVLASAASHGPLASFWEE